ncbi:FHA domain-containing protein, partial [Mycobacterium simiae]
MDDRTELVTTIPRLELRAQGRTWQTTGGRSWNIGRAYESDIQLENPRVSRQHAVLQPTPAGWVLINRSRNGMFIDGRRVESLTIDRPVTVVLGSASSGEPLEVYPIVGPPAHARTQTVATPTPPVGETTVARPPTAVYNMGQVDIRIGRATDNQVVLDDLLVSRYHAVVRRTGNQWELVDNHSANGTYVNGN